jgi:predicted metal-dependent phosphoesterase TrpH
MKLNLHNHSSYSHDAITSPLTMLKVAKKNGMIVGVTDHGNAKAWKPLEKHSKELKTEFIKGIEFMCFDEKGKKCGELIGLYLNEPIENGYYMEIIDRIKEQNGLLMVPHPFDTLRHAFEHIDKIAKKIDLMEGYNSRSHFNVFNKKAEEYAKQKNIPVVANSDSHVPEEICNAWTEVNAENAEEARKPLLAGEGILHGKKASLLAHFKTQLAKRKIIGEV